MTATVTAIGRRRYTGEIRYRIDSATGTVYLEKELESILTTGAPGNTTKTTRIRSWVPREVTPPEWIRKELEKAPSQIFNLP